MAKKKIENYIRDEMESLYRMFEYARWYPAWGAKKILGITLPPHQERILRSIWFHKYIIALCSRRTGKTFIAGGLAPILQCLLFPNTEVGIVAPTFREAQVSFKEVEAIYEMSPIVRVLAKHEPKHGNTSWYIKFQNGSDIMAMPMGREGDSIRGEGFNYLFFDEYNYAPNANAIVDNVLVPMLFTKKGLKNTRPVHPMSKENKFVIASTAGFAGSDYHTKLDEYKEKIQDGNKDYDIVSFDYRDGVESGLFDKDMVLEQYEKADELTKKMEYENIFVDGSKGYIGYELLFEKALDNEERFDEDGKPLPPETQIEFEGEKGYEYILAFDDADTYDNFAVAVIKLDGKTKRLVRVVAENNVHVNRKEKIIRELVRDFNIVRIIADQRHRNVTDALASPQKLVDGTQSPCILKVDDYEEELERVKSNHGDNVPYENLIKIHNFTSKSNEQRAKLFRGEIEKSNFKIPAEEGIDSKEEEEAYNEIKKAINEIIMIEPKTSGRYIKYDTPSRTMHKDRFTVCELGNYCAEQYLKTHSISDDDIFVGGWRDD
ncbi:MAG: terminase large subunit domain-containing protein [Bacillota bacterium]